jgi:hypothetical protein
VHDWGQVCLFQGKNGRDFRAFTSLQPVPYCERLKKTGEKTETGEKTWR